MKKECPKNIDLIIFAFAIEDSSKTDRQVTAGRKKEGLGNGAGPRERGAVNISGDISERSKRTSEKAVESGVSGAGI